MDRSKAAPMDWKYDSPGREQPGWARGTDDACRKRQHMEVDSPKATFPSAQPSQPRFGANNNTPFMFHSPQIPKEEPMPPWVPPTNFSPKKMFTDVEMVDPDEQATERAVAPGAMQRVFKSRQRQQRRSREDQDSGDEDEDEGERVVTKSTSNHYTLNMPSAPPPPRDLPYLLSGFLQIGFNAAILSGILFLLFQFLVTMKNDVNQRVAEYSMDIVQEIALCASHYTNNLCQTPLPAMALQCASWETCMKRNPNNNIGVLRVWAEVFAEVFNAFVEPISWKALAFTLTTFGFSTIFINVVLSLYRSRHREQHSHPHLQYPPQPVGQQPWIAWNPPVGGAEAEGNPRARRRLEGGRSEKIK